MRLVLTDDFGSDSFKLRTTNGPSPSRPHIPTEDSNTLVISACVFILFVLTFFTLALIYFCCRRYFLTNSGRINQMAVMNQFGQQNLDPNFRSDTDTASNRFVELLPPVNSHRSDRSTTNTLPVQLDNVSMVQNVVVHQERTAPIPHRPPKSPKKPPAEPTAAQISKKPNILPHTSKLAALRHKNWKRAGSAGRRSSQQPIVMNDKSITGEMFTPATAVKNREIILFKSPSFSE